ncbi:hypothetical protein chiPu_0021586, partial [Chiloscyllium punctatum]|nr:hypothetical protein [Chiloscyllium punctatum]
LKENFGCKAERSQKDVSAYQVIKEEVKNLGRMTFAEIAVLILFILLVILWFTRDPGFIPGWATVLFNKDGDDYVTDATVVMFISVLMFIIPSDKPRLPCFHNGSSDGAGTLSTVPHPPLLGQRGIGYDAPRKWGGPYNDDKESKSEGE